MESKTNKTLTFPLPLWLDTINIDFREEGGDAAARREGSAEGTASAPNQNIKSGEYQDQRCKNE
jgi:hypothetical protein